MDSRQNIWSAVAAAGALVALAAVVVGFVYFNRKFKEIEKRLRPLASTRRTSTPTPEPSGGQQAENNELSRRIDKLERSLHSLRDQMFLPKVGPTPEVPFPRPADPPAVAMPDRESGISPMPDDKNFNREYLRFYNEQLKRSGSQALIELRRSWKDMAQMSLDRESFLAREGTFLTSDKGIFYVLKRQDGLFEIYLDPTANPGRGDIITAVFEVQGNGAQIVEMSFPAIFEQDQSAQRLKLLCKGEIAATP